MKSIQRATAVMLLVLAGPLAGGCECSERRLYEMEAGEGTTVETEGGATAEGLSMSGGVETEEAPDVARFLGVFHYEGFFVPFGTEFFDVGSTILANLEINDDGTATMTTETCDELEGTREITWRWRARPGPRLELTPGPGEDMLRFMAWTDLESLHATMDEPCDMRFELDGEPAPDVVFRPGAACWVKRCDGHSGPNGKVHLDYCDGEEPPPCE